MIERYNAIRAQFQEQYEALSARDQRLALGLVIGVVLVLAGVFTWTLHRQIEDKASRVRSAKESLAMVMELSVEHDQLAAKIAAAEARMGQFRASQVNTYVETWATLAGVNEGLRVQEIASDVVGGYKERTYRVNVQKAELDGLVRFLYAIETSPYPIRIQTSTIRVVDTRDNRVLDLGLELVAYSKDRGEEG
jgi:type II secretory pathway component PulM